MATQKIVTPEGKLLDVKTTRFARMKQGTIRFMREFKEFKAANWEMNAEMSSFKKQMSSFQQALNTQEVLDSPRGDFQCLDSDLLPIAAKLQLDADAECLRQSAIQLAEEKTGTVNRIRGFKLRLSRCCGLVYLISSALVLASGQLVNAFGSISPILGHAIFWISLPILFQAVALIHKTNATVRSWQNTWDDLAKIASSSVSQIQDMFATRFIFRK